MATCVANEKQWISREAVDGEGFRGRRAQIVGVPFGPFGVSGRAMLSVGQFGPQALNTDELLT